MSKFDDFFDGFDEPVAIVGGVVGLDGHAQESVTIPLDDGDFDLEFFPQAVVVVLLTGRDGAECHLIPPQIGFVRYRGEAGDASKFLANL